MDKDIYDFFLDKIKVTYLIHYIEDGVLSDLIHYTEDDDSWSRRSIILLKSQIVYNIEKNGT